MSKDRLGTDFFVGLFLLLGFGMIAAMVVVLGRTGQGMKDSYPLVVQFPNASGLVRGCDVFISGANVGVVTQAPQLTGENYSVSVTLNIREGIQIPRTSSFQIRTNGMLGDAYVDIAPPSAFSPTDFAQPGEIIIGRKMGGFDDLTTKGGEMIDRLNTEVLAKLSGNLDEIKVTTTNLNTRLLSDTNLKNVEETFANLKEVTAGLAKTSRDLDGVLVKAEGVIEATKGTMKTTDLAAAELRLALADFRKTADTATQTVDSAKVLIKKVSSGEGTLGALVSDKEMAADLKALITNMRRSGVVFYKDRAGRATPAPRPGPPARR
jgi:phospholipid/cholesterol/gamma-HCH transport system substrate-binding protein